MTRLPYISHKDFNPDQLKMFDNITSGGRGQTRPKAEFLNSAGGLSGPFHPWIYAPNLGNNCQALGADVRFHASLPGLLRELAILVVAEHWRAKYEWWAHAKIALAEGMSEDWVAQLEAGAAPDFKADKDADVVYKFAHELVHQRKVSDATYAAAAALLPEAQVVEIVVTVGYYTLVSMTLNTFEVPVPDGEQEPFTT